MGHAEYVYISLKQKLEEILGGENVPCEYIRLERVYVARTDSKRFWFHVAVLPSFFLFFITTLWIVFKQIGIIFRFFFVLIYTVMLYLYIEEQILN